MTTEQLQAIVEAELLTEAKRRVQQWADGVFKPSEESLRFHAFEAGMHAGLQGANHRKDCQYNRNVYRRWWMHGCIVGEDKRHVTAMLYQQAEDWAASDDAIRKSCEKVMAHEEVHGDSYGVPPVEELVDHLAARLIETEAKLQRVREYRDRLSQTTGDVAAREVAAVLGQILEG